MIYLALLSCDCYRYSGMPLTGYLVRASDHVCSSYVTKAGLKCCLLALAHASSTTLSHHVLEKSQTSRHSLHCLLTHTHTVTRGGGVWGTSWQLALVDDWQCPSLILRYHHAG